MLAPRKPLTGDLLSRINFVKERLSFADVAAHYGHAWAGDDEHQFSCHFHGKDKNPSAHYYSNPEKRIWCFACGEGGDVVWYVKKKEGLRSVVEALDFIAKTFAVGLDNQDLSARIEQEKLIKEQKSKRDLYASLVSNDVNDFLHVLRRSGIPDDVLDPLDQLIFDRRFEIENTRCDYLDYVGLLRNWVSWAKELLGSISNPTKGTSK